MQLIAIVSMLVDHIGLIFFPDDPLWRVIGRLAFPMYAYRIVTGFKHTRNRRLYAKRLAIIGTAAQLPYMIAFDTWRVNVIATFLVAIGVLWVLERYRGNAASFLCAGAAAVALDLLQFEYGSYGLFLILIYRYLTSHAMVAAHTALNLVYAFYADWILQFASLVSTLLLAYGPRLIKAVEKIPVPRWLWLSFYPAHLAVLASVDLILKAGG